jgi:hypothetical protein
VEIILVVYKGGVNIDIWLNGTINSDKSAVYPSDINATCKINMSSQNSFIMEKNGSSVGSQSGQRIEYSDDSNVSVWNFTCYYDGSENYTAFSRTNYMTVNVGSCDVDLWLNSGTVDADNTIPISTEANATAVLNVSGMSWTLLRNGSTVDSGIGVLNESMTHGAGTYNYTGYWDGNVNYTGCSEESILTVGVGTSQINITFTPESPQDYGTQVNVTCYIITGDSEANLTLYRNSTPVVSGSSQQENIVTLAAGSYNYTCTYNASENYTVSSDEDYFIVNRISSSTSLLLNGSSQNVTIERTWLVNITGTANNVQGTIHLYNDSVLITSCGSTMSCENVEAHPGDVGTMFEIMAVYNQTQNYTGTSETFYIIINNTIPTVPTLLYPIDNEYTADNTTTFDWSDSNDPNSEQIATIRTVSKASRTFSEYSTKIAA